MATNREKYIDSMTDKELALFLSCGSQITDNQIDTNISITNDEKIRKQVARNCIEIEKWLSQEVEEDKKQISCNVCKYAVSNGYPSSFMHCHICMNSKSARYNKRIDIVKGGCDKGEIKGFLQEAKEDKTKTTETKTADEMFEELGYKKAEQVGSMIIYHKTVNNGVKEIAIRTSGAIYCNGFISKREDKIIHKKIEELKNEQRRN